MKTYRCPGCDQEIRPGVPHLVAWPADGRGDLTDRRHWHTGCWRARDRRAAERPAQDGACEASMSRTPSPIRANSILPARPRGHRAAHRRRAAPGRRAGAAAGRARPGGHAGLPAPAAHPRRHDGQPRAAQGRLAAAGAGRPRGAALQHPRHRQRARHQRGRVRRRRGRAVRRGRRDRVRRVRRAARDLAARLVVRHRPGAAVRAATRPWWARSCCRRRCARPPRTTCAGGPRRASR